MVNAFLGALSRATADPSAECRTENGDLAHGSSADPVVDFFALAGAMRDQPEVAADLFEKAYRFEPQTAVRVLFYLRDVRGGQGERDVFRAALHRLWTIDPCTADAILHYVPEYGRWDDLFVRDYEDHAFSMVGVQWDRDVDAYEAGEPVSLMAKWLPSDKGARVPLARSLREYLGLSQRDYRHTLSALRSHIGLVEHAMSSKDYSGIDYSRIPGQAHRKHVQAFYRNDMEAYTKHLKATVKGEAKVNAATVYPYEVYDMAQNAQQATAAEAIWKNLPDYTRPGQDAIVLADVSGSMWGRPMSVSVSLALYFAQRNTGAYSGCFMTFSSVPKLVRIPPGAGLVPALWAIQTSTSWCGSTNLGAAFDAILRAGRESGEVPAVLYIISDMQFDVALNRPDMSTFESAKLDFAKHGLELPHVVFWNVDARHVQVPATVMDGHVTLVSGLSPSVFAMAVEGKTARQVVDDVVESPRYAPIVI